jgi:hypothetical protein
MNFHSSYSWDDDVQSWESRIEQFSFHGSHYEFWIYGRSHIHVLIGLSSSGLFACMPDSFAGCRLNTPNDFLYNQSKLIHAMDNAVDGTTIAFALKFLAPLLTFH